MLLFDEITKLKLVIKTYGIKKELSFGITLFILLEKTEEKWYSYLDIGCSYGRLHLTREVAKRSFDGGREYERI
jgi:hypothetical protein